MLENLKVSDLLNLVNALKCSEKPSEHIELWERGKVYFIRTVTMHLIGKLQVITPKELLLKDAVWVADSGRFNNALKTGELNEVEPFVDNVILNRDCIVDATEWKHAIPNEVK